LRGRTPPSLAQYAAVGVTAASSVPEIPSTRPATKTATPPLLTRKTPLSTSRRALSLPPALRKNAPPPPRRASRLLGPPLPPAQTPPAALTKGGAAVVVPPTATARTTNKLSSLHKAASLATHLQVAGPARPSATTSDRARSHRTPPTDSTADDLIT
ncbi:unnamed protein product, partial [Tilletia caries]